MFARSTVFILGAGASWHYGYPTGEELVARVIKCAETFAAFCQIGAQNQCHLPAFVARNIGDRAHLVSDWWAARDETLQLVKRLREVNPTLIDYFLAQNPDLHDIGRLVIALVILDCEYRYDQLRGNENHLHLYAKRVGQGVVPRDVRMELSAFNDDWLRFVLYKLTVRCDPSSGLAANQARFVTFNYDTSVERRLFSGLSNISHFRPDDIKAFMTERRFLHVYGAIREKVDETWKPQNVVLPTDYGQRFHDAVEMLNRVFEASKGIRTIDGADKLKNQDVIDEARDVIDKAEVVYILGFGFDRQNVERLGMANLRPNKRPGRTVFLTNFGGHNRVSMAAGAALLGNPKGFMEGGPFVSRDPLIGQSIARFRYEMSYKNVYDALSEDFESMEAV
jgi:hypothetical protein